MREIKFKAFDKKNNKIVENPSVYDYSSDEGCWFNLNIGLEDDDFIFLQYIGLKDKNNVEIYENDIVKRIHLDGNVEIFVVGYEGASFCLYKNNKYDDMFYGDDGNFYEVIGNIYQNQELI